MHLSTIGVLFSNSKKTLTIAHSVDYVKKYSFIAQNVQNSEKKHLLTFPRNPGELVSLADQQSKTQRYATGNLHIKGENSLNVQLLIKNYVDFK